MTSTQLPSRGKFKYLSSLDGDSCIDLQDIRLDVKKNLTTAFENGDNILLEALPASGKSYNTFEAAKETNEPLLYLTSLNKLKNEAVDHSERCNLSHTELPVPHSDCPSFIGTHGDQLEDRLTELYSKGVSGSELHSRLDLPCGPECPYLQELNKDFSEIDVLIGNPKHAYNPEYTSNRIVVKDEFSEGEYEYHFKNPRELINRFLQETALEFENYSNLLDDKDKINDNIVISWFSKVIDELYRDVSTAMEPGQYHALAPVLTFGLIYSERLTPKWERFDFGNIPDILNLEPGPISEKSILLRNRERDEIYLLNPPDFGETKGFVGLDGTPIPDFWETATGLDLTHVQVLNDSQKEKYVRDVIDLEVVELNDSPKPYGSSSNITVPQDTTYGYSILQEEGEKPGLISSEKALYQYDELNQHIDGKMNFANVLSSNDFGDKEVGYITGMPNYGDEYLEKWASYQGDTLTSNDERGSERQYTWRSNGQERTFRIHPYYRNLLLQAVFRFGRKEDLSPTVYVNSSGLPNWVPVEESDIQTDYKKTERIVLEKMKNLNETTAKELANTVDFSKRTVEMKLNKLEKLGEVTKTEPTSPFQPNLWCVN